MDGETLESKLRRTENYNLTTLEREGAPPIETHSIAVAYYIAISGKILVLRRTTATIAVPLT